MARFLTRGAYDVLVRGERRRQGYKYVVRAPWTIELGHDYGHFACHHQRYDLPPRPEPFFELKGNILIVHPGYHWDGCSGPTWDTAGNMGPGLAHDCLYQAMRLRSSRNWPPRTGLGRSGARPPTTTFGISSNPRAGVPAITRRESAVSWNG